MRNRIKWGNLVFRQYTVLYWSDIQKWLTKTKLTSQQGLMFSQWWSSERWCCSLQFSAFIWRISGPRSADAYVYLLQMAGKCSEAVRGCAQLWHCCLQTVGSMCIGIFQTQKLKAQFSFEKWKVQECSPRDTVSHLKGLPLPLAYHFEISGLQNHHISSPTNM